MFQLIHYRVIAVVAGAAAAATPPLEPHAAAELFAFGPGDGVDPSFMGQLDGLSTLTLFHWPPRDGLFAAAHAHNVKLVHAISCAWPAVGSAGCTSMHSPLARAEFVRNLSALLPAPDGINVDIEGYAGPPHDLTSFVRELRAVLPASSTLSVDVSAWPINPHYRRIKYADGYNYSALAAPGAADYLVVMGYDMEWIQPCSNVAGNCSAPALWNPLSLSPLAGLEATVEQFRSLGVRSSSLVMALPFYGLDYACNSNISGEACTVYLPWTGPAAHQGPPAVWPKCQRNGCPSHLPGGSCPRISHGPCKGGCGQIPFTVSDLLEGHLNTTAVSYETFTASAVFDYINESSQRRHQVWYDDAHTLFTKSAWAKKAGLRGVGVYELGMVNLQQPSGMAMWDSVSRAWKSDESSLEPGWRLAWGEEFTGSAGLPPNVSRWNVAHNRTHGELEQQLYVQGAVALSGDGHLLLTTTRVAADAQPTGPDGRRRYNFTSGWVDTQDKVELTYGRWEVRARLPNPDARGIWPAHWLMPRFQRGSTSDWNCWPVGGEIDIMESTGGVYNNTVLGTYHWGANCTAGASPPPPGPNCTCGCGCDLHKLSPKNGQFQCTHPEQDPWHCTQAHNFSAAFHVFAVEWEPTEIRWYVDKQLYWSRTLGVDGVSFIPSQPLYLILNTAIQPEEWNKGAGMEGSYPTIHAIDYVRVLEKVRPSCK